MKGQRKKGGGEEARQCIISKKGAKQDNLMAKSLRALPKAAN